MRAKFGSAVISSVCLWCVCAGPVSQSSSIYPVVPLPSNSHLSTHSSRSQLLNGEFISRNSADGWWYFLLARAKTYFVCLKAGPGPILANICWLQKLPPVSNVDLKCDGDMFTGMTPSICVQFNLDKAHGVSSGYQGIADLWHFIPRPDDWYQMSKSAFIEFFNKYFCSPHKQN